MGAIPAVSRAAALAALAQPTRLKIIEVIATGDAEGTAAGVIARRVECPASTLSFHLKELAQAGLLEARPRGRFILYAVVAQAFDDLARFVAALPGSPAAATAPAPPKPRGRGGKRKTEPTPTTPAEPDAQLSIF